MVQIRVTDPLQTIPKIHDTLPHRVCAYCRVSTNEEDQRNSLSAQKQFFASYFDRKPNWINVGIFADEGLSGTSVNNRPYFNEMIRIARQGKVDLILTKEVSRFSRNAQDLLNIVVELRNLGIYIWFLSDDINTEENNYREKLTQIAANAEQESLRTSRRVKWGHQQQMNQGIVFGRKNMYGYKIIRDESGKQRFEIVPEEAAVIKQIFRWYSLGDSISTIAKRLKQIEPCAEHYQKRWNTTVIIRLLRNEKYVGDLVQGKTYTPDPLTHKKKYNHGEYYRYYIQNHHAPIIDRKLWDSVQSLLKPSEHVETAKVKYSNRYWCSGKIYCGLCGNRYTSYTKKQKIIPYRAWNCMENHQRGKYKEIVIDRGTKKEVGCNNTRVNDRVLNMAVREILEQMLLSHKERIISKLQKEIIKLYHKNNQMNYVYVIQNRIANIEKSLDELTIQLAKEVISEERYTRVKIIQELELADLKKQMNQLLNNCISPMDSEFHISRLFEKMKSIIDLSDHALSEELFRRISEKIVVYPLNILQIHLSVISHPVILQYKTQGKGATYDAIFTILTQEQFEEYYANMHGNVLSRD